MNTGHIVLELERERSFITAEVLKGFIFLGWSAVAIIGLMLMMFPIGWLVYLHW